MGHVTKPAFYSQVFVDRGQCLNFEVGNEKNESFITFIAHRPSRKQDDLFSLIEHVVCVTTGEILAPDGTETADVFSLF